VGCQVYCSSDFLIQQDRPFPVHDQADSKARRAISDRMVAGNGNNGHQPICYVRCKNVLRVQDSSSGIAADGGKVPQEDKIRLKDSRETFKLQNGVGEAPEAATSDTVV
jgi:hypothetical protein